MKVMEYILLEHSIGKKLISKDKGSLQQDQRANNNAAEQEREENENNGANAQISTAAETSGGATTSNTQKRALQLQGSYNLKATPKTPEEIAQEALLRYERRGRK